MSAAWMSITVPIWGFASDVVTRKRQKTWREPEYNPPSSGALQPEEAGMADAHINGEAFGRWLNDKLCQLYGSVLQEPIPEELIELIQAHRKGDNP